MEGVGGGGEGSLHFLSPCSHFNDHLHRHLSDTGLHKMAPNLKRWCHVLLHQPFEFFSKL